MVKKPIDKTLSTPYAAPHSAPYAATHSADPMDNDHAMSMLANAALNATPVDGNTLSTSNVTSQFSNPTLTIPMQTTPVFKTPSTTFCIGTTTPSSSIYLSNQNTSCSIPSLDFNNEDNLQMTSELCDDPNNNATTDEVVGEEMEEKEISNVPDIDRVIRVQLMKSS